MMIFLVLSTYFSLEMEQETLIIGRSVDFTQRWGSCRRHDMQIRDLSPRTERLQFIRTFRLKKLAHGESVGTKPTYTMWVIIHY